jgi:hypothetical protein
VLHDCPQGENGACGEGAAHGPIESENCEKTLWIRTPSLPGPFVPPMPLVRSPTQFAGEPSPCTSGCASSRSASSVVPPRCGPPT